MKNNVAKNRTLIEFLDYLRLRINDPKDRRRKRQERENRCKEARRIREQERETAEWNARRKKPRLRQDEQTEDSPRSVPSENLKLETSNIRAPGETDSQPLDLREFHAKT